MSEATLGRDSLATNLGAFLQASVMKLSGDTFASNLRAFLLSLRYRRAIDAGVWNGHSYEDIPAIKIPM